MLENQDKKLGLGIIAFEGTELIAQIVTEIKDLVDYIVVGFQKQSYTGQPCDPNDEKELQVLLEEGLIDKILYIDTDKHDFPRVQETQKRNALVDDMASNGCTHELIIDSDEFYSHNSFKRAKEKIYNEDIEMSYCRYVNYFRDYRHYLVYPFEEGQYVPFIAKIKYKFAWKCKDFPLPSDPTRRFVIPRKPVINPKTHQPEFVITTFPDGTSKKSLKMEYTAKYHLFEWKELKMHHLSWIRANIRKKMNAWSSKSYFDNYLEIIDKSAERYNNFTEENKNDGAFLLFNVPDNKVDIETFSRQFIFPKIDYRTRTHNEHHDYKMGFLKLDDVSFDGFIRVLDSIVSTEVFNGHNANEISSRTVCGYDYVILSCKDIESVEQERIKDFVSREVDDSIIYFDDEKVVLSFASVEKIRKYAMMEWNIDYDWMSGWKLTIDKYCKDNGLTRSLYTKRLPN